jgi:hypothetical protein
VVRLRLDVVSNHLEKPLAVGWGFFGFVRADGAGGNSSPNGK